RWQYGSRSASILWASSPFKMGARYRDAALEAGLLHRLWAAAAQERDALQWRGIDIRLLIEMRSSIVLPW
ncbi:MAG TPA: hypothetical protein VFV54_11480, partial [Thermoanaerobaculia bacterium]|nr:hypothetical protein [Thermoanaerobaculia bacterium]